jgi:methylenetetrahydrofolate reductase (NADPH)
MRIDQLITGASEPQFSFEFFPPKTEEGEENLFEAVEQLVPLEPAFISVTYGAGGSTRDKTIEIVSRIRDEYGIEAMPHFTCVDSTVDELRATLDQMQEIGIENVLALRGDPPDGASSWTQTEGGLEYSRQLVELISAEYPFAIGAAAFPETHIHAASAEQDLEYLKQKVDAGADFLVTQLFFDNDAYFDFVLRAREAGIEVPIIPGVMPIGNVAQLERMTTLSGATIPTALHEALLARGDDTRAVEALGVSYATLQCAELLAGGAPGIHFYTLNRSPATHAILGALKLQRPWLTR